MEAVVVRPPSIFLVKMKGKSYIICFSTTFVSVLASRMLVLTQETNISIALDGSYCHPHIVIKNGNSEESFFSVNPTIPSDQKMTPLK